MRMRIPRFLALAAFSAGWGMIAPATVAQSVQQHMLDSTVMVYGAVQEDGKMVPATRASGFVIDATHVATNLDACCGKTDKGQQTVPFVIIGGTAFAGNIVQSSPEAQMAILEMEKPTDRPAVAVAPVKLTQKGQPIFTVQWPNPGDKGDPAITKGTLDGVTTLDQTDVQIYQANAPMNHANAGGALFDACGNAIGLNQLMKDGSDYAFVIDPLLDGLESSGAHANVVDAACAASSSSTSAGTAAKAPAKKRAEWRLPQGSEWIPVVVVLGVVALAFRKNTRQQSLEGAHHAAADSARTCSLSLRVAESSSRRSGDHADCGSPSPGETSFARNRWAIWRRVDCARWDAEHARTRPPRRESRLFPGYRQRLQAPLHGPMGSRPAGFRSRGSRFHEWDVFIEWRAARSGAAADLRPGDRFYIGDLRNQFEVSMEESS